MKKILVIEDSLILRANIVELLRFASYSTFEASSGKEGEELAMLVRPDLIICDIMMANGNGFYVLDALQKQQHTRNIPFIFLTAKAAVEDFRYGLSLGADDYITKPFDEAELLAAIQLRIQKNERHKEDLLKGFFGLISYIKSYANKENLKAALDSRYIRQLPANDMIFKEGMIPTDLYFLLSGKVKNYKMHGNFEQITKIYHPGDFLGAIEFFESKTYWDNSKTLDPTILARLSHTDLEQLKTEDTSQWEEFLSIVYRQTGLSV